MEDHRWCVRADGRILYWGSYPALMVQGEEHPVLARVLRSRNYAQQRRHDAHAAEMGQTDAQQTRFDASYVYTTVARWGRVDDAIVSFALRDGAYHGGEHPMYVPIITENIHAATGEQVALDTVVTGREALLTALGSAFRAQYPGAEEYTPQ